MKKMLRKLGVLTLVSVLFLSACAPKDGQTNNEGKIKVVTTSYALSYFIEKIGGDNVEVVFQLTGNPHHFELTQADASVISKASLFMNVDAGDYKAIGEQIMNVSKDMKYINVAEGMQFLESDHTHSHDEHEEHDHSDEAEHDHENHDAMDPHVWLDPVRMQKVAENIEHALVNADDAHKEAYQTNGKEMQKQLKELYETMKEELAGTEEKSFLVSHGAYVYLAERFHLNQKSITSASDHSENTQQSLIELDKFIDDQKITTLFEEENVEADSLVKTLVKQKNLKTSTLYNLETRLDAEDDYFEMMYKNAQNLRAGIEI